MNSHFLPVSSPDCFMLTDIQSTVSRYAEVIATVASVDVEVVDTELVRIAGTGRYAAGVGRSLQREGEAYRYAMRLNQPFFLDNPREHPVCEKCLNRAGCRETLSLCTPILNPGVATGSAEKVAGIIGLVCFTPTERERVLMQREVFTDLLAQLAELIGHKLANSLHLAVAKNFLELMLQSIDRDSHGVLVFNIAGRVTYMNTLARQALNLPATGLPSKLALVSTGSSAPEQKKIKLLINGRQRSVVGQLTDLASADPQFAKMLVFDSRLQLANPAPHLSPDVPRGTGLDAILGRSRAILELKLLISRVATSTSTVYITGESGTGKELVARAVHQASNRATGPFVAINCGAIPDQLLESELFGYIGGAFTGASLRGRMGHIEMAQGGVLFLDEVGSLPLPLQAKLLRVLQERQLTRLGSNRSIPLDIRVIAATNEDLPQLIRQGRYREDLYYRLHVIPLAAPPLRERLEDIDILTRYFLATYAARFGKAVLEPDTAFFKALSRYSWPGNVRELENALEFLVNMLPDGGRPEVDLLPLTVRQDLTTIPPAVSVPELTSQPTPFPISNTSFLSLAELERRAIAAAIAAYGPGLRGKRAAAAALGISQATLYRKLKAYRLAPP